MASCYHVGWGRGEPFPPQQRSYWTVLLLSAMGPELWCPPVGCLRPLIGSAPPRRTLFIRALFIILCVSAFRPPPQEASSNGEIYRCFREGKRGGSGFSSEVTRKPVTSASYVAPLALILGPSGHPATFCQLVSQISALVMGEQGVIPYHPPTLQALLLPAFPRLP